MKLFRPALMGVAASLLAWPALAQDAQLSGVEVVTDLSAYASSNAMEYWPSLDDDLGAALAQKSMLEESSDAPRIRVEINKVAIDGDTLLPDTGEFNQLEGTVQVYEALNAENAGEESASSTGTVIQSFPLNLSAMTADAVVPEGWTLIAPSKGDFYNALVNGYADEVLKRVGQN